MFADLLQVWQFADLRFGDQIFFAICRYGICVPTFFADLKFSQIRNFFIFLLTNTYLKCSNLIFHQIKNSAKQICCQLLVSFAIKVGKKIRYFVLFVLWWKICGFAICGLLTEEIYRFADLRICDSIKRNMRIWNFWTHISQKFADLRFLIEPKNLRICMPTFVNLPPLSTKLAANLPQVSTIPVAYCPWYQQHRW
jgi:hypothetical protein